MIFCTESANGCLWMVLKGFFANINMKLKKNLEVMDIGTELSIKSNPLLEVKSNRILLSPLEPPGSRWVGPEPRELLLLDDVVAAHRAGRAGPARRVQPFLKRQKKTSLSSSSSLSPSSSSSTRMESFYSCTHQRGKFIKALSQKWDKKRTSQKLSKTFVKTFYHKQQTSQIGEELNPRTFQI